MLASFKPAIVILALGYYGGSSAFDNLRPDSLNAPLKGFHQDVTMLATDSFRRLHDRAIYDGTRLANHIVASNAIMTHVTRKVDVAMAAR